MAQEEAHVLLSGDVAVPQTEEKSNESDSEGGSISNKSEDGGASDGDEESKEEEEEEEEGEEMGEEQGEDEGNSNAGWAQAMAKVLGKKTAENHSSILVKNKELDKIKAQERREQLERKQQVTKRQECEMMCRQKPNVVKDRETERALQRIATRGVVQLFNAVRKHQKTVDVKLKEVGGSERKKAKILSSVSKRDFIHVLRGEGGASGAASAPTLAGAAAEEKPAWSVLREDFMMGATMKDWDKESDEEGGDRK